MENPKDPFDKFEPGDLVYLSDSSRADEWMEKYWHLPYCFFGVVRGVTKYLDDNSVSVEVYWGAEDEDFEVCFYDPDALSPAKDLENMTLKEFSEKFDVTVLAKYNRKHQDE